jgi:hypothetical protein
MNLQALQRDWLYHLYSGAGAPTATLRDATDARRFAVYRASLLGNLSGALADTYPVVARLIGAACFGQAARCFIPAHRSRGGDIHAWGREFADFLEDFEPTRGLPYLPDVARLEWLAHEAFHAADAVPLSIDALAALPGDAQETAVVRLHPSLRLVRSAFPVRRIWQANQENYAGDMRVDLGEGAEQVAIFRDGLDIAVLPLAPGAWRFAQALMHGETLAGALDIACCDEYTFDPALALHTLFSHGLVADPSFHPSHPTAASPSGSGEIRSPS